MENSNNDISNDNISEQKALNEKKPDESGQKKLSIEDISKKEVTKAKPNKTGINEKQTKEKSELQKKEENKTEIINKNIKKEIGKDSTNISQSFLNLLKYIDNNTKGNNPELIIPNIREKIKEIDSLKKEKEL